LWRRAPRAYHVGVTPLIGMTADVTVEPNGRRRYRSAAAYSRAVTDAGGLAMVLPVEPTAAEPYAARCDAFILTGGDDPRTDLFGEPTHPKAEPIDQQRQAFELKLLAALTAFPEKPVLGICLGMQLQALHAGGRLDQHLPDLLGNAAAAHRDNRPHPIQWQVTDSVLSPDARDAEGEAKVVSNHHQAVSEPGGLRTVATAPDGVIEAIDDPARPFYAGLQWHPERGDADGPLSLRLIRRFVAAARSAR